MKAFIQTFRWLFLLPSIAFANNSGISIETVDISPLVQVNDDFIGGFVVEHLESQLAKTNLNYRITSNNWGRALTNVIEGKTDALFPTIKTVDRQQQLLFPDCPIVTLKMSIYTDQKMMRRRISFRSILKGVHSVAIMKDVAFLESFERAKKAGILKLTEVSSFAAAFRMLERGRVQSVISEDLIASEVIRKYKLSNVVPLPRTKANFPVYLAFSKNNQQLLDFVNTNLPCN